MQPIVRTASALIRGFGSSQSWKSRSVIKITSVICMWSWQTSESLQHHQCRINSDRKLMPITNLSLQTRTSFWSQSFYCNVHAGSCLDEAVDGHDGHVWLALSIVHQVEVDQLLQLQIVCLHAVHHIREQRAESRVQSGFVKVIQNVLLNAFRDSDLPNILANSHGSNDLLHCLFSLLLLLIV